MHTGCARTSWGEVVQHSRVRMDDGHEEALADFKAKVEWSELINPIKDGGFLFVNNDATETVSAAGREHLLRRSVLTALLWRPNFEILCCNSLHITPLTCKNCLFIKCSKSNTSSLKKVDNYLRLNVAAREKSLALAYITNFEFKNENMYEKLSLKLIWKVFMNFR